MSAQEVPSNVRLSAERCHSGGGAPLMSFPVFTLKRSCACRRSSCVSPGALLR